VETIGEGGMGTVYKCRDDKLERWVAIKVLHQKYAADPHYRDRFRREARTIASISHSCVAQIHDIGENEDPPLFYIVMEYLEGRSVETLLDERGFLPREEAVRIVRDTAVGLREALARGVIHRDVKPSNLVVTEAGGVKIVDFGLAKELSGKNSLTDEGIVMGTPHYISPEQGKGRKADHRSDIYSLGATFYHMVTGRPPFEGDSNVSVIVAHLNETPVPAHLLGHGVPVRLSSIVSRMMAKAPEDRYASYDDLIGDLNAFLDDRSPAADDPALYDTALYDPALYNTGTAMFAAGSAVARGPRPKERAPPGRQADARRRRPAALAGTVLLGLVAALAALWASGILPPGSDDPVASRLGGWFHRDGSGLDGLLDLDFSKPLSGLPLSGPDRDLLDRLVRRHPDVPAHAVPPRLDVEAGELRWENCSPAFALDVLFASVKEIRVGVGPTRGNFDLGLFLVDHRDPRRRSLCLRLRPSQTVLDPIVAVRHGEILPVRRVSRDTPLAPPGSEEPAPAGEAGLESGSPISELHRLPPPLPEMPRLRQGPFEIFWTFEPLEEHGVTRVHLRLARKPGGRDLYEASCEIQGTDWASGVFLVETPSQETVPFSASLKHLLIEGTLSHEVRVETIPWRS
jgi:tRNA A-37 threonylcarbamoyl transferase component Bud32